MNAPRTLLALVLAAAFAGATLRAEDEVLHFFTGDANDGAMPQGDVLILNGTLYGMTGSGGASSSGVVYKLGADGGDFAVLQSLPPGSYPAGSLISSGSALYGMTSGGGSSNRGTIFRIDADGGNYTVLRNFSGGTGDGRSPFGSLVLSGTTLYGMTQLGGENGTGAIFSMNLDGSDFTILHSFLGGTDDGRSPSGTLLLDGDTLYGMTPSGGAAGGGVVFRIGTDGTGFDVLQSLSGSPQGSLAISGTTLYGTTFSGGSDGNGTVFRIGTDGSGFDVLHSFTGTADDGGLPSGTLTLVGSTLYGTTQIGGAGGSGTVFQMNLDGSGFALTYSFAGGDADGTSPQGSLVFSDGRLYGTTAGGGPTSNGTVFALAVPEPGVIALCGAGALLTLFLAARRRRAPARTPARACARAK